MKKNIRSLIRKFGYDVVKYKPVNTKSVKSDSLSYYETATGNFYLPTDAKGDVVANEMKHNRIFEKEVVDCALKYIKEDTLVLDIGANFGQMSILYSSAVGQNGNVYSFEADDFVFQILKKNIAANHKEKTIIPFFGAVHNVHDDTLYFPVQDFEKHSSYGSHGIDYKNKTGRPVKTLTIDSLNIDRPVSFMKVDIQGGDLFALKGAADTIRKNRMPILFEFEYLFQDQMDLKFQEYVDFVKEIGYEFERVIYGHNYLILPKK